MNKITISSSPITLKQSLLLNVIVSTIFLHELTKKRHLMFFNLVQNINSHLN